MSDGMGSSEWVNDTPAHFPLSGGPFEGDCAVCGERWPCTTAVRRGGVPDPEEEGMWGDAMVRAVALGLAVWSHGAAPGEPSDRCFVARAKVFEAYIRGEPNG